MQASQPVARTHGSTDIGIIRIAFQDETAGLEEISWERLFAKFEENALAFLHQDQTKDGGVSRFFKFVKR